MAKEWITLITISLQGPNYCFYAGCSILFVNYAGVPITNPARNRFDIHPRRAYTILSCSEPDPPWPATQFILYHIISLYAVRQEVFYGAFYNFFTVEAAGE